MNEDKIISISIKGGGYTVEDKINKIQLGKILSIVTSDDAFPSLSLSPSIPLGKHSAKRRTKSDFPSPVKVRPDLVSLHLDPVSDLYGNYWTMKTKSDRVMWILAVLNEKKFEFVNQKEISFVAEKLSDNIPTKFVSSLLDSHKKGGRVAPSLSENVRTMRILKPGLDYVKNLSAKEDNAGVAATG